MAEERREVVLRDEERLEDEQGVPESSEDREQVRDGQPLRFDVQAREDRGQVQRCG